MPAKKFSAKAVETALRKHALGFPQTYEEFPWGERAVKVEGKVFLFMHAAKAEVTMSFKLPQSRDLALDLPFAEPTGYGLGKHGWVTATVNAKARAPVDLLKAWISESYRAVAPRKLVSQLPAKPR